MLTQSVQKIFQDALAAVQPARLFREQLRLEGERLCVKEWEFDLGKFRHLYVVGAGKASGQMALALEILLGKRIDDGLVIVKYGHAAPCRRSQIREAGHPVPDQNGLQASKALLSLVERAEEDDLVICLISGGGSALLEVLPPEVSLAALRETSQLLLQSGAPIEAINTVRKRLSRVKGGELARAIAPATCLTLIISDVIGDPLEAIASGPTVADSASSGDAWQIVEQYRLAERLPEAVRKHLRDRTGESQTDPPFNREKVHNIILGNNGLALSAAESAARRAGFHPYLLSREVRGEAREVAKDVAGMLRRIIQRDRPVPKPAALLFGGETTVTVRGSGKGGRNQELALAALLELSDVSYPFALLCCGTDGSDGPTDAAGAVVTSQTAAIVRKRGLDPQKYLDNNDSYHFLRQVEALVFTGPTGTNVMDLGVGLIP